MLVRINKKYHSSQIEKKIHYFASLKIFYSRKFNSKFIPFSPCYFCLVHIWNFFEIGKIFEAGQNIRSWMEIGQAIKNQFKNGLAKRLWALPHPSRLRLRTVNKESAFFNTYSWHIIRLLVWLLKGSILSLYFQCFQSAWHLIGLLKHLSINEWNIVSLHSCKLQWWLQKKNWKENSEKSEENVLQA